MAEHEPGREPSSTRLARAEHVGRSSAQWMITEVAALDDELNVPIVVEMDDLESASVTDRYEDLGLVREVGGACSVRRVRDHLLRRVVAMKVLQEGASRKPWLLSRFTEESQIVAQLEHPGIIPVYDAGQLDDGRPYFTMPLVQGRTLRELIVEVHRSSPRRGWETTTTGWTFRRLIDVFARACEAVAHAHARGVIHRDLKPESIIIAERGSGVVVTGWGLAKLVGTKRSGTWPCLVVTDGGSAAKIASSRGGDVLGTPPYMSPEHAQEERLGPHSDVYALGAVLYQILSGKRPYPEREGLALLLEMARRPPRPLEEVIERPVDEELLAICAQAMARDPKERYLDAGDLAGAIGDWLEGTRNAARAADMIEEAARLRERSTEMRDEAAELRRAAEAIMETVPIWAPESRKLPGWTLEDQARDLDRKALAAELEAEHQLHAALVAAPGLPAAHAALAQRYAELHRTAELHRDEETTRRTRMLLSLHVEALPQAHERRQRFAEYLSGEGALTLYTEPGGAEALLYRYTPHRRRMKLELVRSLGKTPLVELSLPMGSYMIVLERDGHLPVRYPVLIGRENHWAPIPPGGGDPVPVKMPMVGSLGPDEVFIPGGWFISGGDQEQPWSLPEQWVWVGDRVMQRFPVTNRRLHRLPRRPGGPGPGEPRPWPARSSGALPGKQDDNFGAMIYGRRDDKRLRSSVA